MNTVVRGIWLSYCQPFHVVNCSIIQSYVPLLYQIWWYRSGVYRTTWPNLLDQHGSKPDFLYCFLWAAQGELKVLHYEYFIIVGLDCSAMTTWRHNCEVVIRYCAVRDLDYIRSGYSKQFHSDSPCAGCMRASRFMIASLTNTVSSAVGAMLGKPIFTVQWAQSVTNMAEVVKDERQFNQWSRNGKAVHRHQALINGHLPIKWNRSIKAAVRRRRGSLATPPLQFFKRSAVSLVLFLQQSCK